MKNLKNVLCLMLLGLLLVSCSKKEVEFTEPLQEESVKFERNPEYDAILSELFNGEPIPFSEFQNNTPLFCDLEVEECNEPSGGVDSRVNRRREHLIGDNISIIDINVLDNCPEEWDIVIKVAVYYMNQLNNEQEGRLTYRYNRIDNNVDVFGDINIRRVNWGEEGVIARASFPFESGNPGNRIRINADRFDAFPLAGKILVAVHEIGHTIGFNHTDTNDGFSNVGTCTDEDIESIMYTPISHLSLYSDCDESAYAEMYGN